MVVKGIGNLVRVTDCFPSPSRVSFGLDETIMIIGRLSGFHFIVDFIS